MKKIYLDTNFPILPFTMKVDIFSEIARIMHEPYELILLEEVEDELNKIIKEQKGKHRDNAKAALRLLEAKSIKKEKGLNTQYNSKAFVDDIIFNLADKSTIVATQDKDLKARLKIKGIKVIYLRKKKLEMEDVL